MMDREHLTSSPQETEKLGEKVAKEILRGRSKGQAVIVGLVGELGGGKTTFLKGLARGLGVKEKILSPTFVILKKFKITKIKNKKSKIKNKNIKTKKFEYFYHLDCYRIKKPEELLALGLKEIINDPNNVVAIEWAEKIKKILPAGTLLVKFELVAGKENQRKIAIFRLKSS